MSEKILLVDDETDMLEMMAYNLGAQGYQILTAVTGLDALNKSRRFLPDLSGVDISPMVLILICWFVQIVVLPNLAKLVA